MSTSWHHAARLLGAEKGAVALTVAILSPVLIGMAALALDIAYYRSVHSQLQTAVDAAALAAVQRLDSEISAIATAIEFAGRNVPASYGAVTLADNVELGVYDADTRLFTPGDGIWIDVNAVRVTAERSPSHGNELKRFFGRILGDGPVTARASAVAARHAWLQYDPPVSVSLANEAGDYNEMYAYCFDYKGSGPASERRSQMTLIANNMPPGSDIRKISNGVIDRLPPADWEDSAWPGCAEGESLSLRLRSIRHAKSHPELWSRPDEWPYRPEYDHYTDTAIVDGKEEFNLEHPILETIRCDSIEECDPDHPDNILPQGTGREPRVETRPCMPGKFMYFGWEDRPDTGQKPNRNWTDPGWTDLDFDDIRILMKCPETGLLGDGIARLVL
ncbi:MAG TPA: pilus assembly protein TadG-related protein [Paracoccaceae bacterium]|nr:pilus assembly protein TadG-related protein [Paracoccaceae bacterium]